MVEYGQLGRRVLVFVFFRDYLQKYSSFIYNILHEKEAKNDKIRRYIELIAQICYNHSIIKC
mgnify:CR=1 FL=1